jgi:hypothetical protein
MIPFQLVVHVLLTSRMAAAFQSMVKRTMIAPRNTLSLKLERRIAVGEQSVEIQDTLIPEPGMATLSDLRLAEVISMHSPSGRQDRAVEYEINENALLQAIERLNEGAPARLRWVWRVGEAPKMTLEHFEGR